MNNKIKRLGLVVFVLILVAVLCGCGGKSSETTAQSDETTAVSQESPENEDATDVNDVQPEEKDEEMKLLVTVNDNKFTATLENNAAVNDLVELLKQESITVNLSDYSGFEKVGSLGHTLTTENSQMTTRRGDIVLYNANQVVMFYGSNSWSYTKLAHIDDLTGWEKKLGKGDVTVTFELQ